MHVLCYNFFYWFLLRVINLNNSETCITETRILDMNKTPVFDVMTMTTELTRF